ncbi:tetrahydroberberine oxidase-like [Tasmannia lanceolata]|uniref:tetrahydroberberine oxidase-like n=1 Tax=Tasmannia lanceolata TaxID=3420 RepID=UPI004064524F
MKSYSSATLTILSLLLISIPFTTSTSIHKTLHNCLSLYSPYFIQISKLLHIPNTTSYSSLLQSSIQNQRFLSPKHPKAVAIITPTYESQVQASIICCKKHGLEIRVLSGGHDYEGLSYLSQNPFVIISLFNMRSVRINKEDNTAWVQSAATLGELYYGIAKESSSLGFPAGICPTVGIGGHFGGGGIGTLIRKYGVSADHIVDAYLVDANGRILNRESMGESLFWAIRGGGGASFGVILSWKIKLVQVPSTVTVFTIHKNFEQGATKLVNRWQYIAPKLNENLFIRIIMQVLDGVKKGERTIQASFNSLFLGGAEKLHQVMENSFPELGLEPKDCVEMSWIESVLYFAGYPNGVSVDVLMGRNPPYKKSPFKAKSDFVKEPISEKELEGIWDMLFEEDIGLLIMDPLGGRMSEISESEIAFPHRKGNLYEVQYLVKWEEGGGEVSRRHIDWIRRLYKYMGPYVSHSPRTAYINYRDLDLGKNEGVNTSYSRARVWGRKYFKTNFWRLALVKGEVDPGNFFRDEQSIPPLLKWGKRRKE